MPESFSASTPAIRRFSGQVAKFAGNDGQIGNNKEHFDTPANSPVQGFNVNLSSPIRAFVA